MPVVLSWDSRKDNAGCLYPPAKQPKNRLLTVTDELDLDEARRRLTHVARLASVGKVSAGAAHEINQPLNVIRMAAFNLKRAIEKGTLQPESALQKLSRIDEQIDRAARLVGGMKAFSPTASQLKVKMKPSESIRISLALLAKRFSAATVELEHHPAIEECEIEADPAAMQELIMNLVDNALEAFPTEEGSPLDAMVAGEVDGEPPVPRKIVLTESVEGSEFLCVIEDTAGGVPEQLIDRAFQPFVTSAVDGSRAGLGLTTCHSLIAELGGNIKLENAGLGARATVRFPVEITPSDE